MQFVGKKRYTNGIIQTGMDHGKQAAEHSMFPTVIDNSVKTYPAIR